MNMDKHSLFCSPFLIVIFPLTPKYVLLAPYNKKSSS